jgi:uracil-DNA glycosylase
MVKQAGIKKLKALRAGENCCERCPLFRDATQAVPGQGPARARVMLVGEQPGDQEDRQQYRLFVRDLKLCKTAS